MTITQQWAIFGVISLVMFVVGWASREFNFLHLGSKYDKAAESVENLTAEEAQALSDIFGKIAQRLKAPGK